MAQKTNQQLINNIIGQLGGVRDMIDRGDDCFDCLVQMKATRSGVSSLMKKYIEENFINCLDNSCNNMRKDKDNENLKKLLKELVR